ncbi:MAG TPA: hypothetical protein V6D26_28740 [Stenomitos sp.]
MNSLTAKQPRLTTHMQKAMVYCGEELYCIASSPQFRQLLSIGKEADALHHQKIGKSGEKTIFPGGNSSF